MNSQHVSIPSISAVPLSKSSIEIPKVDTKAPISINPLSGLSSQSKPSTPYSLCLDIFEFDPAKVDTSNWPVYSSQAKSPKKKLTPNSTACTPVTKVPYSFLTDGFVSISATRSRLSITTILTNLLRVVIEHDPSSLLPTVYLITGHFGPAYEGIELGIGSQILTKAIRAVSDVSHKELKVLWNKHGDPGDVAFETRRSVRTLFSRTAQLTVQSVFDDLYNLSQLKGPGSIDTKVEVVKKLIVSAKGEEVRYLVRIMCRNLRIGAVKLTVTSSLAQAFCLSRSSTTSSQSNHIKIYWVPPNVRKGIQAVLDKSLKGKAKAIETNKPGRLETLEILNHAQRIVREVYVRHPNYDSIIPALLDEGSLETLSEKVPLAVGIPISPMLGQITRDLSDVEQRLRVDEEFVAEWKYDGQRVQIHVKRGKDGHHQNIRGGQWVGPQKDIFVRLFSRHLEDMTDKYPDVLDLIVALFERGKKSDGDVGCLSSFILDAEICAIDPLTGQLKSFQSLANRSRKDVKIEDVDIQVGIFAFDLMYLNGQPLLSESFRTRRSMLKDHLPPFVPTVTQESTKCNLIARFDHVNSLESTVSKMQEVREFMLEAVANKCEGIMVKILDNQTSSNPMVTDQNCVGDDPEVSGSEAEDDMVEEDDRKILDSTVGTKRSRKKALLASYEPDKRADSWLKVKKDYGELGDSLDLVPIGAWHGQGRKASFWSPVLLALYDPESGGFQAVCKCISGFNDQFYKDLGARYVKGTAQCSSEKQLGYIESSGGHTPDVWFLPSEVWEIRGADITLSPVYKAAQGLIDPDRGLSLRFPRFYRIRDDKAVEDASHPEDFAAMWRRQEKKT
ncbi:hypothetical protein DFH28DRAFT_895909 [Melampsora americana]|nr:hypothetical protein DFH28DRAFT_895909 [Melampsora americana]